MLDRIRIGTRGSALALAQSGHVGELLKQHGVCRDVQLTVIRTTGDQIQDRSLSDIGGKGLFVKEIEEALLDGRVDLAVHSMKDVPAQLAPRLVLTATLPRERPEDVVIFRGKFHSFDEFDENATVGTSSLRRKIQLLRKWPNLNVIPLRGNVDTRLRKLEERAGGMEAILLAYAGLRRLGLHGVAAIPLPVEWMIPAAGQGILALEVREEDHALRDALYLLDDPMTAVCARAERRFLQVLGGSCNIPVAAYATISSDRIQMHTMLADPEGKTVLYSQGDALHDDAEHLGEVLAHSLLLQGGQKLVPQTTR
ncbi:MAG: hydroxymethylbilane synthase [Myxococcales bacterium]|nr:hydroxymethylbilane synthase [Myxococcales bacterium]